MPHILAESVNVQCDFSGKGFLDAEFELGICIFPIASITNYHKFGGLEQIYYLQLWRPKVQSESCWAKIET